MIFELKNFFQFGSASIEIRCKITVINYHFLSNYWKYLIYFSILNHSFFQQYIIFSPSETINL